MRSPRAFFLRNGAGNKPNISNFGQKCQKYFSNVFFLINIQLLKTASKFEIKKQTNPPRAFVSREFEKSTMTGSA
jgi:hypothetical protein